MLRGPGQPLAAPLQEEMEARLGADFSHVRVHTDAAARASAAEVGARAYTSGSHVVIGDGGADKHTFAHELAHVIQQRQGPVPGIDSGTGLKVSDPGDRLEKEAEATAAQVMAGPAQAPPAGHHRPASRTVGATVQRMVVAQITSLDDEKVKNLNIVGRPESPYKGTMGDHSTAFAVQVEAIRRQVLGRNPIEAAKAIEELITKVEELPGAKNLPSEHKGDIAKAKELVLTQCTAFANRKVPESMGLLKIQKMIGDFLHYRELIPLTTMNVKAVSPALAGKGKGEPGPIKMLADHADGKTKKEPAALQNAVWGLLDGQGVALVATESEAHLLQVLAPGIPPDLSQDKRAELIVKQHVMSIDMAYPGLIAQAWQSENEDTSIDKATNGLLLLVKRSIQERREINLDLYGKKIAAKDAEIERYENELKLRPGNEYLKALEEATEERKRYVKVFQDNGGTVPSAPSASLGNRNRTQTIHYGQDEGPKKEPNKKRKRTNQEAAETEEDAVEAESRKQPLTSQIELAENGGIVGFESAGRSASPFASQGMGAHTTAWTVHLGGLLKTQFEEI